MRHLSNAIVNENVLVSYMFRDFDDVHVIVIKELRKKIRERIAEGQTLEEMKQLCNVIDEHHNDFRLWELKALILSALQAEETSRFHQLRTTIQALWR